MSSDAVAIRVRDLSKHYLMYRRPEDRLKQSIVPRLQRALRRRPTQYYTPFTALDRVSFEIRRGETVGIVGRNGSGKSTLLQLLCGTLQPSAGSIEVGGRVAALLELGAGFNPEFTGRENVFLNGAILGLSRPEIEARFDDIAAFADIGQFIEHPVKTYSSGMYVRLAFAVAVSVKPDILVVDEALAVGDEAFQRKCFARIETIQSEGGTILFVSHGAQTIVQLCNHAMLLDRGELILEGRPKTVVNQYQRLVNTGPADAEGVRAQIVAMHRARPADGYAPPPSPDQAELNEADGVPPTAGGEPLSGEAREWHDPALISQTRVSYESNGATIDNVRITTLAGEPVNVLLGGREYVAQFAVHFLEAGADVAFGVLFRSVTGMVLAGARTGHVRAYQIRHVAAGATINVGFRFRCALLPAAYFLTANVSGVQNGERKFLHRVVDAIACRVLPDEGVIAIGYFDLDMKPVFTLDPAGVKDHKDPRTAAR